MSGVQGRGKVLRAPPSHPWGPALTCAVPLFRIQGEAAVTPALKAADGVAALAVGAEARDHLALVDVCRGNTMWGPQCEPPLGALCA